MGLKRVDLSSGRIRIDDTDFTVHLESARMAKVNADIENTELLQAEIEAQVGRTIPYRVSRHVGPDGVIYVSVRKAHLGPKDWTEHDELVREQMKANEASRG